MSNQIKELMKKNGELPSHSSIVGYPLYYVTEDGEILCSYCATKTVKVSKDKYVYPPRVNWEDDLTCECGCKIESAY